MTTESLRSLVREIADKSKKQQDRKEHRGRTSLEKTLQQVQHTTSQVTRSPQHTSHQKQRERDPETASPPTKQPYEVPEKALRKIFEE
jgi:hypothetical protein